MKVPPSSREFRSQGDVNHGKVFLDIFHVVQRKKGKWKTARRMAYDGGGSRVWLL